MGYRTCTDFLALIWAGAGDEHLGAERRAPAIGDRDEPRAMRSLRRVAPGLLVSPTRRDLQAGWQEGAWDGQDVSHGDGARVPVCAGCGKPVDPLIRTSSTG